MKTKSFFIFIFISMFVLSCIIVNAKLLFEDDFCTAPSKPSNWTYYGGCSPNTTGTGSVILNYSGCPVVDKRVYMYHSVGGGIYYNMTFMAGIYPLLVYPYTPCGSVNMWITNSSNLGGGLGEGDTYGLRFNRSGNVALVQCETFFENRPSLSLSCTVLSYCPDFDSASRAYHVFYSNTADTDIINLSVYKSDGLYCNYSGNLTSEHGLKAFPVDTIGFNFGNDPLPNNCTMLITDAFIRSDRDIYNTKVGAGCLVPVDIYDILFSTGSPTCWNQTITYSLNYSDNSLIFMVVDCYGDGKQVQVSGWSNEPEVRCLMNRTRGYNAQISVITYGQSINDAQVFSHSGIAINASYPDCYDENFGGGSIHVADITPSPLPDAIDLDDAIDKILKALGIGESFAMFLGVLFIIIVIVFMLKYTHNPIIVLAVALILMLVESYLEIIPLWISLVTVIITAFIISVTYRNILFGKKGDE